MADQGAEMDDERAAGDELIERVSASLREPVVLRADFDDRVMREVRAIAAVTGSAAADVRPLDASRRRPSPLAWIVRPRTVRISPLVGLAAAAAISAITVITPRMVDRRPEGVPTVASGSPATVPATLVSSSAEAAPQAVQFVLVEPGSESVTLVGSFNDWDTAATRLRRGEGGVWSVELPLTPGRYTYSFVVDGTRWLADPAAPRSVDDDFGTPSSVLTVGSRQPH